MKSEHPIDFFIFVSNSLLVLSHQLQTPELLPVATKNAPLEDARKALRWLRNLQNIQYYMENWLRLGGLPEQQAKAEYFSELIEIYVGLVKIAQLTNPETLNHWTIEGANFSVGSIALSIALHTLDTLPDNHPEFEIFDKSLDDILPEWDIRQGQSIERLLDDLESGISYLAGKPMGDRTPLEQLLEISEKIGQVAQELYSIENLQEPAREESIELAREILRRLKNMTFTDMNLEDVVDTGRPNEKVAFAKKIAEMVEIYKNMLGEAVRIDPKIMNDPRVKKASIAVDDCEAGIKRMAMKIMQENGAMAGQSIPQIKKHNSDKTDSNKNAKSIMQNMEGGIEQAAKQIEQKKTAKVESKPEPKKDNQAQNVAQAQEELAAQARRRRRRAEALKTAQNTPPLPPPQPVRRQTNVLQSSTVEKPKNTPQATGLAGLNIKDLTAVMQAGNALKNSNKQASNLVAANKAMAQNSAATTDKKPVANVVETDKISPDDRNFANREQDQKNNPRNKPRVI